MATTNIRWVLTKHLLDLLRQDHRLQGVDIFPGWPGDRGGPEVMWIMGFDGTVNIPVMTGGRKQRDDEFDVSLEIRTYRGASLDDTYQRLTEMVAAVEDILAEDPAIGAEDISTISVTISSTRMTCALGPEGNVGFAEVDISFHTRLY